MSSIRLYVFMIIQTCKQLICIFWGFCWGIVFFKRVYMSSPSLNPCLQLTGNFIVYSIVCIALTYLQSTRGSKKCTDASVLFCLSSKLASTIFVDVPPTNNTAVFQMVCECNVPNPLGLINWTYCTLAFNSTVLMVVILHSRHSCLLITHMYLSSAD